MEISETDTFNPYHNLVKLMMSASHFPDEETEAHLKKNI